jgi:hypothetical protein
MPFQNFFFKMHARMASGTFFFPGIGVSNTTALRPIFGSLFVFWNRLFKKNSAALTSVLVTHYFDSPILQSSFIVALQQDVSALKILSTNKISD